MLPEPYPVIHPDDESTDSTNPLNILCAGNYPAQPVEWLWPGRIPIGKVTLMVGDPGAGKSLVALDIAARVSRAAPWPDEAKGKGGGGKAEGNHLPPSALRLPPSSVLLLSATDDFVDTIRPRLDAAGADCDRIFVIPSIADLRHDFAQLRAAVDHAPNCRLIVIDPINAYVGPADSQFQTVVRDVLAPLARLATEKRIAVLAIAHLRKNDGAAIYRAAGSMGFVAAARAVWTVCPDHTHPGRHLFLPLKNNLAATACGLAYTIEPHVPTGAPAIVWHSSPITTPAEQALAPPPKLRGPEAFELNAARDWLRQALADGPRSASQLAEEAAQRGFHERTLRRALYALGGHTQNRGPLEGWWWKILDRTENKNVDGTEKLVPSQTTCPLPEIINEPSPLRSSKPPSAAESIAALNRLQRQRRPSKTANPILDSMLDAFRKPLSAIPQNPSQIVPDSS